MLSKCANPNCSKRFIYFREGKLFRWDGLGTIEHPQLVKGTQGKPARKTEFFWLCGNCATSVTVVFRKGSGVTVRPIERTHKAAS
jgi:hypothetical protein